MKQITREKLVEGMAKARFESGPCPGVWKHIHEESKPAWMDESETELAYLESVGTVVRGYNCATPEWMVRDDNGEYPALSRYLLLPYDPRPKPQPSAKKRAAESLRALADHALDAKNWDVDAIRALADELEAE